MERVLLQPANSILQPAKKTKDLNKVSVLLQDLGLTKVATLSSATYNKFYNRCPWNSLLHLCDRSRIWRGNRVDVHTGQLNRRCDVCHRLLWVTAWHAHWGSWWRVWWNCRRWIEWRENHRVWDGFRFVDHRNCWHGVDYKSSNCPLGASYLLPGTNNYFYFNSIGH